jgi:hypothetical protein
MKKIFLLCFACLFSLSAFAAEKKPLKAAALSLLIPGGGQFYNESYTKFGVVALAETSLLGYSLVSRIKAEDSYDEYLLSLTDTDYNKYVEYYSDSQNGLWWAGTLVFLSVIDAYVDAHLFDFEAKKRNIHLKFEENKMMLSWDF